MNPNEIKKALECCFNTNCTCEGCPYGGNCGTKDHNVARDTLAYINQLEAKSEKLEKENQNLKTEIEKLNIKIDILGYGIKRANERENSASVNAVKKFANNLCENRVSNDPVIITVKQELKKIVGDIE